MRETKAGARLDVEREHGVRCRAFWWSSEGDLIHWRVDHTDHLRTSDCSHEDFRVLMHQPLTSEQEHKDKMSRKGLSYGSGKARTTLKLCWEHQWHKICSLSASVCVN